MKTTPPRVEHPPDRPTLLWDGDCGFCGRCVRWMERQTGAAIAYQPYQSALVVFPELPEAQLEQAVHLVEPSGAVTCAAEAIYGALAVRPRFKWLIGTYRRSSMFAALSEWGYRRVANNRSVISWLTRSRQR